MIHLMMFFTVYFCLIFMCIFLLMINIKINFNEMHPFSRMFFLRIFNIYRSRIHLDIFLNQILSTVVQGFSF